MSKKTYKMARLSNDRRMTVEMNTEDEINYRGHTIELVGIPRDMPNFWRAFSMTQGGYCSTFISEGKTRDEAIRLAQLYFDREEP